MKLILKSNGCFCQKGENAVKSQKVIFQKSQKALTENFEDSMAIHFNSGLCNHRTGIYPRQTPALGGE